MTVLLNVENLKTYFGTYRGLVKAVGDFSIHIKVAIDVRTNNGTKTSFTFATLPSPPDGGEGRVRGRTRLHDVPLLLRNSISI